MCGTNELKERLQIHIVNEGVVGSHQLARSGLSEFGRFAGGFAMLHELHECWPLNVKADLDWLL